MCTRRPYRGDVVLAPAALAARPEEIERLNTILEEAGLGRPLGPVRASTSELAALSVSRDPQVVSETLLRAGRERGMEVPELTADFQLRAGTSDHNPRSVEFFFGAAGKKSGHGICWEPALGETLLAPPTHGIDQLPADRRPVVALLDNGVEPHPFLAPVEFAPGVPLLIDAEEHDWTPRAPIPEPEPTVVGSHHGHGTFIAGLVHKLAPDAQLLSVKVMSDEGAVSEQNVIKALEWLAGKATRNELRVDIVCMAFGGREEDASPTHAQDLRNAIARFADLEVRFIASAGNDHCNCRNLPASLAEDPSLNVVSVGADSERQTAAFSNFGEWVTAWEAGTFQLSIIPLTPEPRAHATGLARWSGTSFSAANLAGKLVQKIIDDADIPRPVG